MTFEVLRNGWAKFCRPFELWQAQGQTGLLPQLPGPVCRLNLLSLKFLRFLPSRHTLTRNRVTQV